MYSIVYITAGDENEAYSIAETLVKEKLAACCNVFPIRSIYRWKGKVERESEFAILAKTKSTLIEHIVERVKGMHSYELPCVISFSIKKGSADYLKWIGENTR